MTLPNQLGATRAYFLFLWRWVFFGEVDVARSNFIPQPTVTLILWLFYPRFYPRSHFWLKNEDLSNRKKRRVNKIKHTFLHEGVIESEL